MKKIINGKVYDTNTAERVAEWSNNRSSSDFSYVSESLYRKRTGEFFIYGAGGPMSKYSVSCGNNDWGYGEKIIPMSYEAAQKWAEDNLPADIYESIFGEVIECTDHITITLSLPSSSAEKAKRAAAQNGISMSAYIDGLINA